ncbi:MAG TPA: multicopper oxidase family protein [Herpetosiphonaceae bacterium]
MKTLTRRELLRLAGAAALALPALGGCGTDDPNKQDGSTGTLFPSVAALPEPFKVPLPIPPVLAPVRSDADADYYEIVQRPARVAILPGLLTEIWGYNGIFPGPTIESRRGRRAVVTHRNELPAPTVTHLHGAKTPPEHDGYPLDLVLPVGGGGGHAAGHGGGAVSEGERTYDYPLEQPAATLWYHDHRMDFTGPQVWRGLAGFHIHRDEVEDALPLPKGEREIPLMICDRSFNADGSLRYPSLDPSLHGAPGVSREAMHGVLGDVTLVNGAPWPVLEVANVRYRFRILNASNARRYKLALDPAPAGASFVQIGSDQGLLGGPARHAEIEIAQAERFDVLIDFGQYPVGSEVTLVNRNAAGGPGLVMRFRVARAATEDSQVPERLAPFDALDRAGAAGGAERFLNFARQVSRDGVQLWTINGRTFDPAHSEAQVPLGATEIWRLHTNVNHPVHIHLGRFQVLSRAGGPPRPTDAGWKDTIDLRSNEEAEVIVRFEGYRGRYVCHCHNLEHEDMMMMANFDIV